ncbi:hypothetical protein [Pseudomonas gingeri]|nr:hypothetical protein [Pseudomonas gingeri]
MQTPPLLYTYLLIINFDDFYIANPIKEQKMGHASFSPCLPDQRTNLITIISEHHGWRTLSGIQTSDYYAYRNAIRDGCHLQRVSFELRHPEEMICDLSNLDPIYNGMHRDDIVKIWEHLNLSTRKMEGRGGIGRVEGNGLSPELAISGPSKSVLTILKNSLISEAFNHIQSSFFPITTKKPSRGVAKNRLLTNADSNTLDFHNRLCIFYSQYVSHEQLESNSIFNTRYIYEDHEIWHQIENLSKNKLFLLSAGLPLALGYMAATGDQNVFFLEIHRQNDSSLLNKNIEFQDIFPTPTSSRDPWLIIDKAYTGGSLRQAANTIRKKYGYSVEIKTVALFPKSFSAFMGADYAVYAGKLFDVRAYTSRLDRDLWHMQLIVDQTI